MKKVPLLLIAFRLVLGPIMITLIYNFKNDARMILVLCIFLGILSDIFDGIVARRIGTSSEKLRRMDSQTDLVFWICTSWCAWLLNPEIIIQHKVEIIVIFAMEAATYAFSIIKFGKETCTHAWLSKMWGITLFVAFVSIIGFGYGGISFYVAFIIGIIAHFDVYGIIFLLPKWTHDVPSSYHAYLIRKGKTFRKHKWFNG